MDTIYIKDIAGISKSKKNQTKYDFVLKYN